MNAYETGHLAFMYGFFLLGCLLAVWLLAVGLGALWGALTRAPEGREDRTGWHTAPEAKSQTPDPQ